MRMFRLPIFFVLANIAINLTPIQVWSQTKLGDQQQNSQAISGVSGELRLKYTLDANVYPKLINQNSISVYRDPSDSRARRYVKPIFMPSWETFKADLDKACQKGDREDEVKIIPLRVLFSSKKLNDEIAEELLKSTSGVTSDKLFSYPVYALFVVSGALNPGDDLETAIQFRYPPGISEILPRGMSAAIDQHLTSIGSSPPLQIKEKCTHLRQIYETRDLSAFAYTEYSDIKLNTVTAIINAFTRSRALSDLERSENASGVISVSSRSRGAGIGFNLGGFIAGGVGGSRAGQLVQDTRRRAVSASLVQDIAEDMAFSGVLSGWIEAPEHLNSETISATLLNFILGEQTAVKAKFEKRTDGQLAIVSGTYDRTLSKEDTKLLLESAPSTELNATGQEDVDCSMMAAGTAKASKAVPAANDQGKQCGAQRTLTNKYSDSIKWHKEGSEWVPIQVDLYSISTQELSQRASLSVETAIVSQSQIPQIQTLMHITDGEPTNYLSDQINQSVNALVAKIDGPKKIVHSFAGGLYKTIAFWAGGTQSQELPCPNSTLPSVDAMFEKVGGQDIASYDSKIPEFRVIGLGCRVPPYCDSADEHCTSYHRASGCFVNKEWADWYRSRMSKQGAAVRVEEMCAAPL